MRRFAFLALIALVSLSAGLFVAPDAEAGKVKIGTNMTIVTTGSCANCSPFVLDGNKVCSLVSCRETGLTDPYGNEFVVCGYLCRYLP